MPRPLSINAKEAERQFTEWITGKDVLLVGPSGALTGSGRGKDIDAAQCIVRLNWSAPVPPELHADLGSRTDVLYKRLLTPAFPTAPDAKEWQASGVQWVVISEWGEASRNTQLFAKLMAKGIPWTMTGRVRADILKKTRTSPLIGVMAIVHLLQQPIRSLTVTNFDFYAGGYHAGYGGTDYRRLMNRKEGTIANAHDATVQLRYLHQLWLADRRLKFDEPLERMVTDAVRRHATVDVAAIIPARYASSRFPGKPLAPILGKPMILWVCEAVAKLIPTVVVATDDQRIADVVTEAGYRAVMTGDCLTGTDRVREAARQVPASIYVNVQGDEPLVDAADILSLIVAKQAYPGAVVNGMCRLDGDPYDTSAVKAVTAQDGRLLYASRLPIPGTKEGTAEAHWKQLGLYAFTREELDKFGSPGMRTPLEASEDVEILRFLELGIPVRMVEVRGSTQAVDYPEHIAIVEAALRARELVAA